MHQNNISGGAMVVLEIIVILLKIALACRPASMSGKTAMAIHGNKLYVINAETPGGSNKGGMYVFDIKPGGNGFQFR